MYGPGFMGMKIRGKHFLQGRGGIGEYDKMHKVHFGMGEVYLLVEGIAGLKPETKGHLYRALKHPVNQIRINNPIALACGRALPLSSRF